MSTASATQAKAAGYFNLGQLCLLRLRQCQAGCLRSEASLLYLGAPSSRLYEATLRRHLTPCKGLFQVDAYLPCHIQSYTALYASIH